MLADTTEDLGPCVVTSTTNGIAQLCAVGLEDDMTLVTAVVGDGIKCVRVREEGVGHLGFLGSRDEPDRNVLQLAPLDHQARFAIHREAFAVHTEKGKDRGDASPGKNETTFDLNSDGIRIEAYTRECWQVCEVNRGDYVVELYGTGLKAREQTDAPCTIVGPVAVARSATPSGGAPASDVVDASISSGGAGASDAGAAGPAGDAGPP